MTTRILIITIAALGLLFLGTAVYAHGPGWGYGSGYGGHMMGGPGWGHHMGYNGYGPHMGYGYDNNRAQQPYQRLPEEQYGYHHGRGYHHGWDADDGEWQ